MVRLFDPSGSTRTSPGGKGLLRDSDTAAPWIDRELEPSKDTCEYFVNDATARNATGSVTAMRKIRKPCPRGPSIADFPLATLSASLPQDDRIASAQEALGPLETTVGRDATVPVAFSEAPRTRAAKGSPTGIAVGLTSILILVGVFLWSGR